MIYCQENVYVTCAALMMYNIFIITSSRQTVSLFKFVDFLIFISRGEKKVEDKVGSETETTHVFRQ